MSASNDIFLSRRLLGGGSDRDNRWGVRFARWGVVVSVLVMVMTLSIVLGFQRTVADKVADYTAHIRLTDYSYNDTYDFEPVQKTDSILDRLRSVEHVQRVEAFWSKPAILKTDDEALGVVLLATSDTCVTMSKRMMERLGLQQGERFYAYFAGESLRVRRLTVDSIHQTGFGEGDDLFLRVPAAVICDLNDWSDSLCSGYLVWCDELENVDASADELYYLTAYDESNSLFVQTMTDTNPQIFAWLALLDTNVWVVIILMMLVAIFSMISALMLLILGGLRTIGTLKALGATSRRVARIYLLQGMLLVVRSMIVGDVLALVLCYVQDKTHLVALDPTSYYVDAVPVCYPWTAIGLLNIAIFVLAMLVLLLPAAIVRHVSPARVMRFE